MSSKATENQRLTRLDDSFWEPIRHEQVLLYILPKKGILQCVGSKKYFQCKNLTISSFLCSHIGPHHVTWETCDVTVKYPPCFACCSLVQSKSFCSYQDIEISCTLPSKSLFPQGLWKQKPRIFLLPPKPIRFTMHTVPNTTFLSLFTF